MKYPLLRFSSLLICLLLLVASQKASAKLFGSSAPDALSMAQFKARYTELAKLRKVKPKHAAKEMEASLVELRHPDFDTLRLRYLYILSDVYLDLGYLKLALKKQDAGLALAKELRDTQAEADFYNQRGITYDKLGRWNESVNEYKEALQRFKQQKDSLGLAHCLNNLGLILTNLNKHESADSLYREVLKLGELLNNQNLRAMAYVNLGISKSNQRNFAGAEAYFKMALELDQLANDPEYVGSDYAYLARVYSGMKLWTKAYNSYTTAIQYIKKSGNLPSLADVYLTTANFYFDKREFNKALDYIDSATLLAEEINSFPLLSSIYNLEWQVQEAAHNSDAALASYKLWQSTQDSLQTWEAELASEELIQTFAQEQNELKLAELEEDISSQKQMRLFWMLLTLLLGLGIIIFIWLYNRLKLKSKELHKHQEALAHQNVDLEEKTHELQRNKSYLQRALNTKTRFLSVVSHEIRTPLHVIRNIGELLTQDSSLSEEVIGKLKVQLQSADQLNKLVDEIFDLNNLESGQSTLKTEIISLDTWLKDVFYPYQLDATFKGLQAELEICQALPEKVEVDSRKLRQVIDNLLSNAVKFTDSGKILFKVSTIEKDDQNAHLRFSITDTGIGLDKQALEKVFEPFHQEDFSMSRSKGGTGLGLSISKGILELLGGQISVESKPGEGSSFHFDIKLTSVKTQVIAPTESKSNSEFTWPKHKKLLIAEDHEQNILILKMLMNRVNAQAEWAKNGLECFTKATEDNYDLILMDLHMPIMDGKEAAERIRQMSKANGNPIRIIGLTAANESEVQELPKGLFDDVLYKPYRPDQLYHLMEQVVA